MTEITKKPRKRAGRPPIEFTPVMLDLLEKTPAPYTVTDMCATLGVATHKFYKWVNDHDVFAQAVLRLRDRADDKVEQATYNSALGYKVNTTEQALDKDGGVHDLEKETYIKPDQRAQQMWLMNRRRKDWTNRVEVEVSGAHVAMVEKAMAVLDLSPEDWKEVEE